MLNQCGVIPLPSFLAKVFTINVAQREHDVGVLVPSIAFASRGVQGYVSNHATRNEFIKQELGYQLAASLVW